MKAHKIEIIVLNGDGYDDVGVIDEMEFDIGFPAMVTSIKTLDIPDWTDDHPLNHKRKLSKEQIDEYFK